MKYKIILASNSPRRKELLSGLDIDYEVRIIDGIEEEYPVDMPVEDIPQYLAVRKSIPYKATLSDDELLITADTVVVCEGKVLGKPVDRQDAVDMLRLLSGKSHYVVTGVCLATNNWSKSFHVATKVTFKHLKESEIDYYVTTYKPYDKAGAYGIQEWIGYIGVTDIDGSYFNVMGLPVQRIWEELNKVEYSIFKT